MCALSTTLLVVPRLRHHWLLPPTGKVMAKTPDFEKITDRITQADIDHFLKSNAPDDVKRQVRDSPDQRTKMRFVAGYLIRTNQVAPDKNPSKSTGRGSLKTVGGAAKRVKRTSEAAKTTAG
jgi:hypothetical protein